MREGQSSFTALAVTAGRLIAGVDPYARMFLSEALERYVDRVSNERAPWTNRLTLGFVAHIAHRTLAIDDALLEASERGVRQVVILGAGYDARAYRLDGLAKTTLFEVDHPATQAQKQSVAHHLSPRVQKLRHVPVDFTRDALEDKLESAGHNKEKPTTWIWEGVTMYLDDASFLSTLESIGHRSSIGSRLVVTYMKRAGRFGAMTLSVLNGSVFSIVGEPLRLSLYPDDAKSACEAVGFSVIRDESTRLWGQRKGHPLKGYRMIPEHVLVADRIG